jgi:hypothetical protein
MTVLAAEALQEAFPCHPAEPWLDHIDKPQQKTAPCPQVVPLPAWQDKAPDELLPGRRR